jgi:hypothetical protein
VVSLVLSVLYVREVNELRREGLLNKLLTLLHHLDARQLSLRFSEKLRPYDLQAEPGLLDTLTEKREIKYHFHRQLAEYCH